MSPAGSGSGEYGGALGARVVRGSMCTWMLPWLLPVGLLGTVAVISLPSPFGYLLAGIWGWLVFPFIAAYVRAHSRVGGGSNDGNGFRDDGADYWRAKVM